MKNPGSMATPNGVMSLINEQRDTIARLILERDAARAEAERLRGVVEEAEETMRPLPRDAEGRPATPFRDYYATIKDRTDVCCIRTRPDLGWTVIDMHGNKLALKVRDLYRTREAAEAAKEATND